MDAVIAKLSELVGGTCADLLGVSQDILSLRNELRDMNVLLTTLDGKEQLDPQLKNWRNQLVETAYDIEDCIDDFKNNTTSVDAKASFISNVYSFLMNLRAHYDTAKQIKELKTRMQEISERRKRLKIDDSTSTTIIETLDPRMPALYNEADSLVGINNPKEELIEWVLDEDQKLKVVSIVGRGGLGKTTLANKVYCEVGEQGGLDVTTHAKRFTHKAFVSVSRAPDWKRILTNMLGENLSCGASDVQSLIDSLRQHLYDKRYLIVVDDLWCVPDWTNIIRCAFPQNNQQSRVIVTTRDVEVARTCCSDRQYIHYMQPLSDTNSRTLFLKRISISEDVSDFQNSEEVICEILKKCGGLPLAIITIASILVCQEPRRLKENWECIQNSLSIHSATNPTLETMVQILDLSYRSLPHDLKPCFLYLGKYPEDRIIRRNDLVRQWVAEGFVRSHSDRDVWDIAHGYFNGLVNRSMIQQVYDFYDNTEVSACRVHDMMLDVILRRCREDNFITVVHDSQEISDVQYKVRRLSMDMSGAKDIPLPVAANSVLSQIRSLFVFGGPDWTPPFLKFKFIRVMFLQFHKHAKRMDLTCIIHLLQLRYFKIECWSSYEVNMVLPSQIQRLQHLETLEFHGWFRDLSIPLGIVDLPQLSHLIMLDNNRGLPDGIGKLNSLCTLAGFCLLMSSSENIGAIGALTNLVNLYLTCLEWTPFQAKESSEETSSECMPSKTCALSSALEKLSRLKQIQISGEKYCRGDTLNSLSPPFHRLERLEMSCVAFPRVPKWIGSLRDLRKLMLVLDDISNSIWKDVDTIGVLPSLVFLSLKITGVPAERIVITGFPVLKRFIFECDGISRLSFEAGAMPNLWALGLQFHSGQWDKAAPEGLEHLPSLKEITAIKVNYYHCFGESTWEAEKWELILNGEEAKKENVLIRVVFQEAVGALSTSPAFNLSQPNRFVGWRKFFYGN